MNRIEKTWKTLNWLSMFCLIAGLVVSIVYSIFLFVVGSWLSGIIVILIGCLGSWFQFYILSCIAEIFGEVIMMFGKVSVIEERIGPKKKKPVKVVVVDQDNMNEKEVVTGNENDLHQKEIVDIFTYAKREIRHLDAFEKNYLKKRYEEWYEEVKKLTNEELYNIVQNNESQKYEQQYVYLCCIEILDRDNQTKNEKK